MDSSYRIAVSGGGSWRWMGYKLDRVRLHHLLALDELDNPLFNGGEFSAVDLLLGAWVCSAKDLVQSRARARGKVSYLGRFLLWWRGFRLTSRRSVEREATRALLDWWLLESQGPILAKAEKSGRKLESPWLETLVCRLMASGMTREEAWEQPVSEALWMQLTQQELSGAQVKILDEDEVERLKKAGWSLEEIGVGGAK